MKSKTLIKKQTKRKTNREIVETINLARKYNGWVSVAGKLSGSTRKYSSVNLNKIDSNSSEGDTVVIIGKVLGVGEIKKRIRVCALGFSKSAYEKLKKTKSEVVSIMDEIKNNKNAKGIKIIT